MTVRIKTRVSPPYTAMPRSRSNAFRYRPISDGSHLARDLGGRTNGRDQARWILTQASRARMVATYKNLPDTTWTAYIRRRFELDALFTNHDVLVTGRMAL